VTSQVHRPVISLMLAVPDAPMAVEWYKRALGATALWVWDPSQAWRSMVRPSSSPAGQERLGKPQGDRHH